MSTSMRARVGFQWLTAGLLVAGVFACVVYLRATIMTGSIELRLPPVTVLVIAACYTVSIMFAAFVWRQLVFVGTGGVELAWRPVVLGFAALMLGKYLPGKVAGLVGRAATLGGRAVPATAGTLTVIEQAYVLAGLVSFAAIMEATLADGAAWGWVLVAVVLAVAVAPKVVGITIRGIASRSDAMRDVAQVIRALTPGVSFRLHLLATLAAGAVCLTAWFVPDMLGIDLPAAARLNVVAAYALAVVVGMLALVMPAGVGAREAAFVLMAQPWLSAESAVAVAAALRLTNVAADLAIGLLGLSLIRIANVRA